MKHEWNQARRILCVRLDSLGDVLMTTPAIRAVKTSVPGRHITLLSSASGIMAASYVPEIDDTIQYDAPWLKASRPRQDSQIDHQMYDHLRTKRFDAALIFTVFTQSALPASLLCYLADIPLRLAHSRENPYQLLTDWIIDRETETGIRHEVERQLDLVSAIGCSTVNTRLSFQVPDSATTSLSQILAEAGIQSMDDVVLIHPGATAASRRYPVEQFAQVADLLSDHGLKIILTGTTDEMPLVQQLVDLMDFGAVSMAGKLDLGQMAALIQRSAVLISNNSGPVHIAAALGTPVVDLYALTNPQHGPWKVPHRLLSHDVPCKYCFKSVCPESHHDCLRKITPGEVVKATRSLLQETRSAFSLRQPEFIQGG